MNKSKGFMATHRQIRLYLPIKLIEEIRKTNSIMTFSQLAEKALRRELHPEYESMFKPIYDTLASQGYSELEMKEKIIEITDMLEHGQL